MLAGFLGGCTSHKNAAPTGAPQQPATTTTTGATQAPSHSIRFTDITQEAGIKFKHNSGAFGLKLMPETMGSGVAFIDYDNDGDQDLFFVNCRYWKDKEVEEYKRGKWSLDEHTIFKRFHPEGAIPVRYVPAIRPRDFTPSQLYSNDGKGNFSNVTTGSGLDIEMYGMGACVGDYDNDGRVDLYVTGLGRNYLFRNLGNGKFKEVAGAMGVLDKGWSTSAAWLDYDKDGWLDLFVCRYLKWTPGTDRYGTMNGRDKSYTSPSFYEGELSHLYHNEGGRKFRDVSAQSGIQNLAGATRLEAEKTGGNSLGVAVCDYNNDEWPDIVVANDTKPNSLFRNDKNGRFTEIGHSAGFALNIEGNTRGSMGIDTADIDHSNRDSVVVGNFDAEMIGLYYNQGKGVLSDIAPVMEVGKASLKHSVFGCTFLDVDNDGWPDVLTASGHIDPQITGVRGTAYELRPLLFHNIGKGEYREIGQQTGEALQKPLVGRGLAYADIDTDGDVDVVLTTNNGPAVLLRNDSSHVNRSIRLALRGSKSNRSAIGTLVKVKFSEKDGLRRWVRSGSSYMSQSELPLTLGLGNHPKIPLLTLRWPSGKITRYKDVVANQSLVIDEDKGVVTRQLWKSERKVSTS